MSANFVHLILVAIVTNFSKPNRPTKYHWFSCAWLLYASDPSSVATFEHATYGSYGFVLGFSFLHFYGFFIVAGTFTFPGYERSKQAGMTIKTNLRNLHKPTYIEIHFRR